MTHLAPRPMSDAELSLIFSWLMEYTDWSILRAEFLAFLQEPKNIEYVRRHFIHDLLGKVRL